MIGRRRDGLCPRCGERPRRNGKGYCRECRNAYNVAYDARTKRRELPKLRRGDGRLCPRCMERPKVGVSYCRPCGNAQAKDRRRRKNLGLVRFRMPVGASCRWVDGCAAGKERGSSYCVPHLLLMKRSRYQAGVLRRGGTPRRYGTRKGRCFCDAEKAPSQPYCRRHVSMYWKLYRKGIRGGLAKADQAELVGAPPLPPEIPCAPPPPRYVAWSLPLSRSWGS